MAELPRPHVGQQQAARGSSPRAAAGLTAPATQIDQLLAETECVRQPQQADADGHENTAAPFVWHDLAGEPADAARANIELVDDVELDLRIELGRTRMVLEDVLRLRRGAVVPLDKLVGEPVDIVAGGQLIARGEVVVLNGNFAAHIVELVTRDPSSGGGKSGT